jgi:hypothetical protein
VIDVAHRKLCEYAEQLAKDALTHGSLDMDSFVQYIHIRGQYLGLTNAIKIIEGLMGERKDHD